MYQKLSTAGGYPLDEVISALQKEIRRAQVAQAIFWAKELIRSGYSAYLWRRLFVIVSEDIGLADDQCPALLQALYQNWLLVNKKAKDESITLEEQERSSLILVHAVMRLAYSAKNREVADANTVIDMEYAQGQRLQVPDYALDGHTARGRAAGRVGKKAEEFFQKEGRVIFPDVDVGAKNPFFQKLCALMGL
jgi:replication-associated recombination protein RarA